jgi:malate dehydrogenase (oxaloacetate-decarboxylating)(NADP+)
MVMQMRWFRDIPEVSSVVKPLMQLIGKAPGISLIATTNIMMTNRGPMFLSDTAINPNPTADDLAKLH